MYKKIYRTMCAVTLASLAVLLLFVVTVSYMLFSNYVHDSTAEKAVLVADVINAEHSLDPLEEGSFSFLHSELNVYTPEGVSLLDGSHNEAVKALEADGFTEGDAAYAVFLESGNILTVEFDRSDLYYMLVIIVGAAVIMFAMVSILSLHIAAALTRRIVAPLENIYSYEQDCVYEELEPFVKRIATQANEIKRQENKVKEQKTRLQTISENMNEGLVVVDSDKSVLLANQSMLALFGVEEEDIKHRDFSFLTRDSGLNKHLDAALVGKNEYAEYEEYRVFYSPVYDKQQVKGVVMLFIDASEQIKTEKIRREFSANVSHELKTPLTTIHGYSQIITKGLAREADVVAFAEKIEQESLRMINLIDDIINLSRLDEQSDAPEKEELRLAEICKSVVAGLGDKAAEKNVKIDIAEADTQVYANKIQLTEMVYNLVDNAIKYNIEGGRVKITVTERGFTVADTGIGIPEKYLDRIYERFFRADKSHSKKVGGTGLGLSIVKHIAGCNGAEISVESTEGKGTIFTVSFKK